MNDKPIGFKPIYERDHYNRFKRSSSDSDINNNSNKRTSPNPGADSPNPEMDGLSSPEKYLRHLTIGENVFSRTGTDSTSTIVTDRTDRETPFSPTLGEQFFKQKANELKSELLTRHDQDRESVFRTFIGNIAQTQPDLLSFSDIYIIFEAFRDISIEEIKQLPRLELKLSELSLLNGLLMEFNVSEEYFIPIRPLFLEFSQISQELKTLVRSGDLEQLITFMNTYDGKGYDDLIEIIKNKIDEIISNINTNLVWCDVYELLRKYPQLDDFTLLMDAQEKLLMLDDDDFFKGLGSLVKKLSDSNHQLWVGKLNQNATDRFERLPRSFESYVQFALIFHLEGMSDFLERWDQSFTLFKQKFDETFEFFTNPEVFFAFIETTNAKDLEIELPLNVASLRLKFAEFGLEATDFKSTIREKLYASQLYLKNESNRLSKMYEELFGVFKQFDSLQTQHQHETYSYYDILENILDFYYLKNSKRDLSDHQKTVEDSLSAILDANNIKASLSISFSSRKTTFEFQKKQFLDDFSSSDEGSLLQFDQLEADLNAALPQLSQWYSDLQDKLVAIANYQQILTSKYKTLSQLLNADAFDDSDATSFHDRMTQSQLDVADSYLSAMGINTDPHNHRIDVNNTISLLLQLRIEDLNDFQNKLAGAITIIQGGSNDLSHLELYNPILSNQLNALVLLTSLVKTTRDRLTNKAFLFPIIQFIYRLHKARDLDVSNPLMTDLIDYLGDESELVQSKTDHIASLFLINRVSAADHLTMPIIKRFVDENQYLMTKLSHLDFTNEQRLSVQLSYRHLFALYLHHKTSDNTHSQLFNDLIEMINGYYNDMSLESFNQFLDHIVAVLIKFKSKNKVVPNQFKKEVMDSIEKKHALQKVIQFFGNRQYRAFKNSLAKKIKPAQLSNDQFDVGLNIDSNPTVTSSQLGTVPRIPEEQHGQLDDSDDELLQFNMED